ncbi:MAG: universal stress protein [Chlorobiaceae bacterium]|jgi:universal stress protein A|nr:universal stress protein [Chlorobiaceae bacterium]NTV16565.1 universal stress protein [Chlorobiaceae bacterium]
METQLKKIICAVDFSTASDAMVRYAAAMHCCDAELIVLSVVPKEESENGLLRKHLHEFSRYSDMLSQNRARAIFTVQYGEPAAAILSYAKEHHADMIILASHGTTAITRLLVGSTAEAVLRHATCPVVILKTPDNNNKDHGTT